MDLWRLHLDNDGAGPVYLNGLDRYTGIFLAGKSGTGKSSLILYWWEQEICSSSYQQNFVDR